jgi:serine/threonine protein kinase
MTCHVIITHTHITMAEQPTRVEAVGCDGTVRTRSVGRRIGVAIDPPEACVMWAGGTDDDVSATNTTLGRGHFSVVKAGRVHHHTDGSSTAAAVKIYHGKNAESMRECFATEVKVSQTLDNPHVVTLLAAFWSRSKHEGLHDQPPYAVVVMPRYGPSLFALTSRYNHAPCCLAWPSVEKVMRSVLLGLAYLASHGITHRDIKPENILRGGGGDAEEEERYVIVDFNTAKMCAEGVGWEGGYYVSLCA